MNWRSGNRLRSIQWKQSNIFQACNKIEKQMGNCTGAGTKSHLKPIQSLGKENLQSVESSRPPMSRLNSSKVTVAQANKKREALKNYLTEGNLDPPKFYVHKIEPLSSKYCKS